MRILVATGIFPPQIGGPATYAKLIYDELPKRGIDVEVASFGDYIEKPKIIRHFLYFLELMRKIGGADAVLALDPISVGLPALFASQIAGKKMVLRVAGDYAWEQGTQRFGVKENLDAFVGRHREYPWQVRLMKRIQTYVAEGASSIITPSKYLKSILVDWGIHPGKVTVIYNGFHMEPVKETPSVLRKHLKWSGKIVITVGRLVPWKGMKEMIEIMPEVRTAHPDARLVIVGDGPEKENLVARAAEMGQSDTVIFEGRLDQKSLFERVKAADAFALFTGYEGFSHQIIETMALGTPVITTSVGGNVEIIRNGENGILVPPGAVQSLKEAVIGLLGDPHKAEMLARTAKKDVAHFTDEIMLDTLAARLKEEMK
ncbi:MAG TPA: glycosyltransferase family 4 protein [Candidatus Paceibacterota bacterium]|nr:glycosyltransferase family 4 protein [Candidatus Paceibacterota bacterium]